MLAQTKLTYRKDIQILRGIAVIAVVGYHLRIPGFENGFLGVDLFFVLSGFLMAAIYKKGNSREFYLRRASRLLPGYFVTILVTLGISFIRTTPNDFIQVAEQSKYGLGLIPNFYFWLQDSYFASANFNPLLHLWSLGVEFQFYLLLPILIVLFSKYELTKYLVFLASVTACLIVLQISPKTSFFILPLRTWEFVAGIIAYDFVDQTTKSNSFMSYRFLKAVSPLAILGVFLFFPLNGFSTSYIFGHPGLASFAITALGVLYLISAPVIPYTKWLETLGKYSYSIYLVHFPLIVLFQYKEFGGTLLNLRQLPIMIAQIILISFFSIALYYLVENPFRRKAIQFKTWLLILLSFALLITIIPNIKLQQLTPKERNIVEARFDRSQYRCGKLARIQNPTSKVCIIGRDGFKKRILLLGNSHADAIKTSFASAANGNSKTVYFWTQNDPLMSNRDEAFEVAQVVRGKMISEVYLHYSLGSASKEVVLALKSELDAMGVTLKILGPVPTWTAVVPEELWRLRNSNERSLELEQTYDDFLVTNLSQITFFKEYFSEGVTFFDLAKSMCASKCEYQDSKGRPLYWDSDHLTLTGARRLDSVLNTATKP
jgi:peptidoglycan/LPS O-acetylase OafA/YrhL